MALIKGRHTSNTQSTALHSPNKPAKQPQAYQEVSLTAKVEELLIDAPTTIKNKNFSKKASQFLKQKVKQEQESLIKELKAGQVNNPNGPRDPRNPNGPRDPREPSELDDPGADEEEGLRSSSSSSCNQDLELGPKRTKSIFKPSQN